MHQVGGDLTLPDRNSYVVTEIAWTIFSSTDMIVLSIFLGTKYSSVYGVYNLVFASLNTLLNSTFYSISYLIGRAYHEGIKKYELIQDSFDSVFLGIMTVFMSVSYVMIMPFVSLYTNGITDINYINEKLPILFCMIQLLSWTRFTSGQLSGIAGYAKVTSKVSLFEAMLNVVLSVIFVNIWGITGVLLATVISLPIKVVFLTVLANKKVMMRSCWKSIRIYAANYLVFIVAVVVKQLMHINVGTYGCFFLYCLLIFVLFSLLSFVLNIMANRQMLCIVKSFLNRRKA